MKERRNSCLRLMNHLTTTLALTAGSLIVSTIIVVNSAQAATTEPDTAAGQRVFARCTSCHSTEAGENRIGPSLAGVVGRESGALPGFDYSNALKSANIVWDENSLDKYLQNPTGFVRGTKMFLRVSNEDDRRNVIAFLKNQSP